MQKHSIRVANNIVKKYGKDGLKTLISLLVTNTSYTDIAKQFEVSRQRVHQWCTTLGTRTVTFTVNTDVVDMLK